MGSPEWFLALCRGSGCSFLSYPQFALSPLYPGRGALLQLHLLVPVLGSQITLLAQSSVGWAWVRAHTCEPQDRCAGGGFPGQPVCYSWGHAPCERAWLLWRKAAWSVAPLDLAGACGKLWCAKAMLWGPHYVRPGTGTNDFSAWFDPGCDFANANTLIIFTPKLDTLTFSKHGTDRSALWFIIVVVVVVITLFIF